MSYYDPAPITDVDAMLWCRKISRVVNSILSGKLNNIFSLTLTANSATTVITVPVGLLTDNSFISLMPTTANAATEFGAGTIYVSTINALTNTFTITHANNANADRTFKYIIFG